MLGAFYYLPTYKSTALKTGVRVHTCMLKYPRLARYSSLMTNILCLIILFPWFGVSLAIRHLLTGNAVYDRKSVAYSYPVNPIVHSVQQ